jgi:hypothetical protein
MKRRLDYESKMVLPDEIAMMFCKAEKNIMENKNEIDKIILHLSRLRYECTNWFSKHETLIDTGKIDVQDFLESGSILPPPGENLFDGFGSHGDIRGVKA